MRKIIQVDGGIGRVICSTPAIRSYYKSTGEKPIVLTSWPEVYWYNPNVYKVYSLQKEWLFDDVIKHGDFIQPEPYQSRKYYSQGQHLAQSFDSIVNGVEPELTYPEIWLTEEEKEWAKGLIKNITETTGKGVIAYQPFGAAYDKNKDATNRSLTREQAVYLADNINAVLLNCSNVNLDHTNIWWRTFTVRELLAIVSACPMILAVDSSLAHIGAAHAKKGIVLFGGTYVANVGWPTFTNITREGFPKTYYANRFQGFVNENENAMAFNTTELDNIISLVNETFDAEWSQG